MRIGIDAYPLARAQVAGIGVYIRNLITHLASLDDKNEYFLYAGNDFQLPFQNRRWHKCVATSPSGIMRYQTAWLLLGARKMLARDRIDLFVATSNLMPYTLPAGIKKILVVHDLVLYAYPQSLRTSLYLVHVLLSKRSLMAADRIITVSNATGNEIRKYVPALVKEKITTVHNGGPADIFKPCDKATARAYLSRKFGLPDRYILTVTSLDARKNLTRLIEAFHVYKERFSASCALIMVIGERRSKIGEVQRACRKRSLQRDVYFLDYVAADDLVRLYNGAELFFFPSAYEGFGFPPLEAMACEIPVVASDIPVFHEVLGDAALFADPYDPAALAAAINRVIADQALADDLRRKGIARSRCFSWERAARALVQIMEETACTTPGGER